MKVQINWKLAILFLIITFGLYLITGSFFMSLGILLLLFIGDHYAQQLENKRKEMKKKKQEDGGEEEA